MPVASNEYARQSAPIECFAFAQASEAWFYTSYNKDIVRVGDSYRAALISRESFNQSDELEQSSIKVLLGYDLDLAERIRLYGLRSTRGAMVLRYLLTHDGDTDVFTPFIGECTTFQLHTTHVELNVESLKAGFKKKLLHVSGSTNCNHDFCGPACAYNKELIRHPAIIGAIDQRTVTLTAAFTNGLLDAGWLEIGPDRWFIEHNVGAVLTMMTKMPTSFVGSSCDVFDGCDHSYVMCRDKYNNTVRHGGFPLFPMENPFTQRYAKERRTGE